MTERADATTATAIKRSGQRLMQTLGYEGFSYRDVAAEVGIRSASIHYHFAAKADLALAVTQDYRKTFNTELADIDAAGVSGHAALGRHAALFRATLAAGRVCLCGMLASDEAALPARLRKEVRRFFDDQHAWLAATITRGFADGSLAGNVDPDRYAATIVAGLEGAMMVARSTRRPEHLTDVADQLIELIATVPSAGVPSAGFEPAHTAPEADARTRSTTS